MFAYNMSQILPYCGNANLNGYSASYQIKTALSGMTGVNTTSEIADEFNQYWNRKAIDRRPNLLVSGYNAGKPSVLEVKVDGSTIEHFRDEGSFGIIYHGDQAVANALIALGDFEYSLFRLQDAIDFCSTMITTTAKIQSFQKKQQTVSEVYDLLVVTECKAKWIKRSTVELDWNIVATGALYPKELLLQIVEMARKHELIIFSDEIYDRLVMDGGEHISIASLAPDLFCVTFSGLSKSHMICGFRVGWMILSGNKAIARDYIDGINMLSNMRLCSNVPGQSIIQTALGGY